jgi:hypothetical protein
MDLNLLKIVQTFLFVEMVWLGKEFLFVKVTNTLHTNWICVPSSVIISSCRVVGEGVGGQTSGFIVSYILTHSLDQHINTSIQSPEINDSNTWTHRRIPIININISTHLHIDTTNKHINKFTGRHGHINTSCDDCVGLSLGGVGFFQI